MIWVLFSRLVLITDIAIIILKSNLNKYLNKYPCILIKHLQISKKFLERDIASGRTIWLPSYQDCCLLSSDSGGSAEHRWWYLGDWTELKFLWLPVHPSRSRALSYLLMCTSFWLISGSCSGVFELL